MQHCHRGRCAKPHNFRTPKGDEGIPFCRKFVHRLPEHYHVMNIFMLVLLSKPMNSLSSDRKAQKLAGPRLSLHTNFHPEGWRASLLFRLEVCSYQGSRSFLDWIWQMQDTHSLRSRTILAVLSPCRVARPLSFQYSQEIWLAVLLLLFETAGHLTRKFDL